ncbi:hypothetical protein D3OALGA1CA_2254 [Olavius algarvensis associated proteobacterium Delta 3]|nr:hypothetical protein D3OALGA1CA_2254 [Olavius algarvensis associated proteobacterium Delta 3]
MSDRCGVSTCRVPSTEYLKTGQPSNRPTGKPVHRPTGKRANRHTG